MTHKLLWLALGTLAIASCTAILGGVPATGGAGGAGGSSSTAASGPGGSAGAGGTRSENGGAGGIGGGAGGAGGGCRIEGAACGKTRACCGTLSCGADGTCGPDAATSSSSGMTPCSTCNDALVMGMGNLTLCKVSQAKFKSFQSCACDANGCEQICSHFCGPQGGALDSGCEGCADTLCDGFYNSCKNDKGCYACSGMLNNGDDDPNDACVGQDQDNFNTLFSCVCGQMTCSACAGFCAGSVISDACRNCVASNSCTSAYHACTGN